MSAAQYALNLGLLAYILISNVGTHEVTRRRLLLPVVLVAVAGAVFLNAPPTAGNDVHVELVGVAAGVGLGLVAGLLVRVRLVAGRVLMTAGAAYAALWVAVIGGRMLFAYGADHWFTQRIGLFSYEHRITGADAWTAAFVAMALAMVLTRVLVTWAATLVVTRGTDVAAVAA
ncbi:hypothetical protein [Nocardioides sp.]|uniref:hypothetical protein n=1 Tax=Nocardioides sp. TaxID=35761 RepID=UPI0037837ED8